MRFFVVGSPWNQVLWKHSFPISLPQGPARNLTRWNFVNRTFSKLNNYYKNFLVLSIQIGNFWADVVQILSLKPISVFDLVQYNCRWHWQFLLLPNTYLFLLPNTYLFLLHSLSGYTPNAVQHCSAPEHHVLMCPSANASKYNSICVNFFFPLKSTSKVSP